MPGKPAFSSLVHGYTMLLVPTALRPSQIHGVGVYLLVSVKKSDLIWRFDGRFDRVYSKEEIKSLPPAAAQFFKTYSSWHQATGLFVVSGDHDRFINHSDTPNLVATDTFSDVFAAEDLPAGTELTCDYRVICSETRLMGRL
jgi:SET domain-containing protein